MVGAGGRWASRRQGDFSVTSAQVPYGEFPKCFSWSEERVEERCCALTEHQQLAQNVGLAICSKAI